MRVLHVIEATIGGTRRHIVDVARGQLRAGAEVWVVSAALRDLGYLRDRELLAAEGVRCIDLPMQRAIRPGRDFAHVGSLVDVLQAARPDVVHTHSSKAGVLGRLAAQQAGVRVTVHTPHTFAFLFRDMFGPLQRGLFRQVESALAGSTSAVVAVSRSEAATIAAAGIVPQGRLRIVPNGIDPRPWRAARPLARATLGVPEGAPLILVAGLLNVAKGQDLALRALAQPGLESAHLLLAGHGELDADLHALAAELGIAPRAHFLGWRDDVPALVATCDVLVLPSRWEGLPYIVLEAFAAERPVVATRVDGALELVEENRTGALAPLEDPAGIALALRRVLERSSAERAELGRAGRALVEARYTHEHMIRGLLALYEELHEDCA